MNVRALLHRPIAALGVATLVASLGTAASVSAGAPASASASTTPAATPTVTKVLVFVEENHSLSQMAASMPFVHDLATTYAYANNYTAVAHPSLPNYLAIAGGSTFGVTDDQNPSAHRIRGASVFDQTLRAGRRARTYAQSQPRRCALTNAGSYAVRHNPWTYFVGRRAACRRFDVGMAAFRRDAAAGHLPAVGMVIPNVLHDAHDGSLATADAWIKKQILKVQAGPDWNSGRLAIVITADEDDHSQGNKVLTVVASKYQQHKVVGTPLTHYSLTRFINDVTGTRYLRNAATAPSMTEAFGVRTRPRP